MNGVMSNIQYMPSPHGVSKRIRLHRNEPFSNPFQGIGQYGYPDKTQEPDNSEVLKTTHIWMRNCQFKEERNAFHLVSEDDGISRKLNKLSTNGPECFKENKEGNLINKDLVSDIYIHVLDKVSYSKPLEWTCRDPVVQSLSFSESDSQNTIRKETVEPSLNPTESNLQNASEDANSLSVSSIRSNITSFTRVNGKESVPSETVLSSRSEKCFKGKSSGSVEKFTNVNSITDSLKVSSRKDNSSSRFKKCIDETKTLQCKRYENGTSKDPSEFHCEAGNQNSSVKCTSHSRNHCKSLENDNYLYHVEKIRKMRDITIEPMGGFGEYEVDQKRNGNFIEANINKDKVYNLENKKESNMNHELITISNKLSEFYKGKYETKDVDNHLNSEKVLSWKAYSKIVIRLPNYELFSDVIQRAVQKVKHSKIHVEPISPEENTASNKTLSKVTENVKITEQLHENTNTKSKEDTLLNDLDELDDFLDFASSKIKEMVLLVNSTSNDIKLLLPDYKDIELALHQIRNLVYLKERNPKLSIEDHNIVTSTRDVILILGDCILKKIKSLELDLVDIKSEFRMNLAMVSRFVYMLCSIPIERRLTDQRDLVYAAMHQVNDQIKNIEVKEKEIDIRRDGKISEVLELQGQISRFHRLNTILDELCEKHFD